MRDIIPTVKIINHAGVQSVKDGMKANSYSLIDREKKPNWIRMTASQANKNYTPVSYTHLTLPTKA